MSRQHPTEEPEPYYGGCAVMIASTIAVLLLLFILASVTGLLDRVFG